MRLMALLRRMVQRDHAGGTTAGRMNPPISGPRTVTFSQAQGQETAPGPLGTG